MKEKNYLSTSSKSLRACKSKAFSSCLKELNFLEALEKLQETLVKSLRDCNGKERLATVEAIRSIREVLEAENRLYESKKHLKDILVSLVKTSVASHRQAQEAVEQLLVVHDCLDQALENLQKRLATVTSWQTKACQTTCWNSLEKC